MHSIAVDAAVVVEVDDDDDAVVAKCLALGRLKGLHTCTEFGVRTDRSAVISPSPGPQTPSKSSMVFTNVTKKEGPECSSRLTHHGQPKCKCELRWDKRPKKGPLAFLNLIAPPPCSRMV